MVNPNLTGLIAMKLCQDYNKPTILVRECDDGVYKGSLRVNSFSPLANFKDFCEESGLVEYAQGRVWPAISLPLTSGVAICG